MANAKKRPSKKAKAAQKILSSSKLLSDKADRDSQGGDEFKASVPTARTNSKAIKPRPDKKRG
jgi:hypothetical protein